MKNSNYRDKCRRIMIIDDDYDITTTFRVFLESANLDVYTCNDPVELIRTYKAKYYDLLLIDIRMPRMNGFKLFQKLKKIDPEIKVCFITGFEPYYLSLKEQFSLDVDCFIRKPISKDELIENIAKKLTNWKKP